MRKPQETRKQFRVMGWPAFRNARENPYNSLLYSALQERGIDVVEFSRTQLLFGPRCDILHLHWAPTSRMSGRTKWHVHRKTKEMLFLLSAARMRGTKIVWTAHNLQPHDGRQYHELEDTYWPRLASRIDAVINLSGCAAELLRARYPSFRSVPSFVTAHGSYKGAYAHTTTRKSAREELGIDSNARVVGFVGQIRPYKNVADLVRAFTTISDPNAVLVIAGELKLGDTTEQLERLAAEDRRVRLFPGFIAPDDIQRYLEASDLIALPYRETLNSGSVILALSFDRPVLIPPFGSLAELARDVGAPWVTSYSHNLTAEKLNESLEQAISLRGSNAPAHALCDWKRVASQTEKIFRALLV